MCVKDAAGNVKLSCQKYAEDVVALIQSGTSKPQALSTVRADLRDELEIQNLPTEDLPAFMLRVEQLVSLATQKL